MAQGRYAYLALGCVLIAGLGLAAEDNPPPEGCHWQPIPELKAHLAVPDDWLFEEIDVEGALVYEVRPGGPVFESPSQSIFRLTVQKGLEPERVAEMARDFVESARDAGMPNEAMEEQTLGVMEVFVSVVLLASSETGVHETTVAVSALANTRTGTLYTTRLDIPVAELQDVAPLGNKLFRTIRVDDEI